MSKVREESFKAWLHSERKLSTKTVGSRISGCKRVERHEGDLDKHYEDDGLISLMNRLNPARPKHRIPINGDTYNGTATLKSAVNLYRKFRDVDAPIKLRKGLSRNMATAWQTITSMIRACLTRLSWSA